MNTLRGGKKSRSSRVKRRSCKNMKSRTCKRSKKCSWRKRSKRAKGSCAKKSRRRKSKGKSRGGGGCGDHYRKPKKSSRRRSRGGGGCGDHYRKPKKSSRRRLKGGSNSTNPGKGSGQGPKKKKSGKNSGKNSGKKGKGSKGKGKGSAPPKFRNIVAIVGPNGGTYREFPMTNAGVRAADKFVEDNRERLNGNFIKVPYDKVNEFLATAEPAKTRIELIETRIELLGEELSDLRKTTYEFYRNMLY